MLERFELSLKLSLNENGYNLGGFELWSWSMNAVVKRFRISIMSEVDLLLSCARTSLSALGVRKSGGESDGGESDGGESGDFDRSRYSEAAEPKLDTLPWLETGRGEA